MENKDFKHFVENNNSVYNYLKDWSDLINRKKIEDEWIQFEGIPNYTFKNPVLVQDSDDPSEIIITLNYDDYVKTK